MRKFALHSLRNWTRTRRVTELLAVLWIVAIFDLVLTLWAHFFTSFVEVNPLADGMLTGGNYDLLIFFKLGATLTGTFFLYQCRHTRLGELATWSIVVVYVALAIHWSTYTTAALHDFWRA